MNVLQPHRQKGKDVDNFDNTLSQDYSNINDYNYLSQGVILFYVLEDDIRCVEVE